MRRNLVNLGCGLLLVVWSAVLPQRVWAGWILADSTDSPSQWSKFNPGLASDGSTTTYASKY